MRALVAVVQSRWQASALDQMSQIFSRMAHMICLAEMWEPQSGGQVFELEQLHQIFLRKGHTVCMEELDSEGCSSPSQNM